ncbi:MAG TPA: c-type cytochrome [Devosia sp.]|nr:c-type cytochrome [Devosia sp.]
MSEHDPISAPDDGLDRELDRPWRTWASIGIGAFALVAIFFGFIVLPLAEPGGGNFLTVVCRALGVPGYGDTAAEGGGTAAAHPASGVTWTVATLGQVGAGNPQAGAQLAGDVCAACHGADGLGQDGSFPRLTHQSAEAIYKQLQDYKSGARLGGRSATMAGIAQSLTDQQIADLAAYYAGLGKPFAAHPVLSMTPSIIHLAQQGDPHRALPACDSCHGDARDRPREAPVLWDQYSSYIEQELQLFASGERSNDDYGRMRDIAKRLTPEEISGLAIYYGVVGITAPAQ